MAPGGDHRAADPGPRRSSPSTHPCGKGVALMTGLPERPPGRRRRRLFASVAALGAAVTTLALLQAPALAAAPAPAKAQGRPASAAQPHYEQVCGNPGPGK